MATKLGSVVGYRSGIYNGYKVIGTQTLGLRGLVLWLKFNEGSGSIAKDSSFYNNHGTIYGATWTDGKFGKALSFDGVDDYVEVSDSPELNSDVFTITGWIHPILPHGNSHTNAVINKAVYAGPPDRKGWYVRFYGTNSLGLTFGVYFDDAEVIVSYTVTEDWHYFAAVYNGTNVMLYVDGELKNSKVGGTTYQKPTGVNLKLGSHGAYHGLIDEVRIYSRALSENEIKMLYYNRIGAVPSKTI